MGSSPKIVDWREELALFDEVAAGERPERFVYVHGPGGIGKTALLTEWARRAEARGHAVGWLDGREVGPNEREVLAALHQAFDVPIATLSDVAPELDRLGEPVLVIDAFEQLAGLERWLRERLFPNLPRGAIVLWAGRAELADEWRLDRGWEELLVICRLADPDRWGAERVPDDLRTHVAAALRQLDDPAGLGSSELARTLAARGALAGTDVHALGPALADLLRAQCDMFRTSPRDEPLQRVVDATFLSPIASSQQETARALGMPYGTYRRYLSQALRRLADALWRRAQARKP